MRRRRRGADAAEEHVPRLHVAVVLAPQFTLSAFSVFVDTLRLAGPREDADPARPASRVCAWTVVGASPLPVRSSCGVEVAPVEVARTPERFDCVVVVGGTPGDGGPLPSTTNAFLRAALARGVPLAGIGTGADALAHLGAADVARSSCAVGGVAELAAQLVGRHCGTATSRDPIVARAAHWIERTLADGRRLAELGAALGISMRQLQRRFLAEVGMTPQAYRARVRLQRSRAMLESTALPVGRIGLECGYADGAHFSRTFRRAFRAAPSRMRGALARDPEFMNAVQEQCTDGTP